MDKGAGLEFEKGSRGFPVFLVLLYRCPPSLTRTWIFEFAGGDWKAVN
jgi:hypothetical protein